MATTRHDLARAVKLQEVDLRLDALQAEIDQVPREIAALQAELAGEKARLADVKARQTAAQLKKKEKENELSQREDAARKHGVELNLVKTNEAFKALQTEIDRAKAAASEIETEILLIMEELDKLVKEEKAAAADLKSAEGRVAEKVKALESRKAGLESRRSEEAARRAEASAGLPEEFMRVYDHTRKRRGGIALSAVKGNTCSVCHIALPPQVVVNAAKGGGLISCESCLRILYSPEALAPAAKPPLPSHAAAASAAPAASGEGAPPAE